MIDSKLLREQVRSDILKIVDQLNCYLRGENVVEIKDILERIGRGGKLPHWYELLKNGQSMPNLDGKTIGSVIEMTFVGVLEKHTLKKFNIPPLEVNPAKGVDIPLLDLGVKSPSENFCTSEPYFSAYERILGNENDAVILLTDYQTAKKDPPPVRLQIIKAAYLRGSEIADRNLCAVAKEHKEKLFMESEALCKKFLQFLCYLNQQDWRAKALLKLVSKLHSSDKLIDELINKIESDFHKKVRSHLKKKTEPPTKDELNKILQIKRSNLKTSAIINACHDWIVDNHKDFARLPNDNEWNRFLKSPLDGKIGMSFALQWRYNFGHLFRSFSKIT